MLIYHFCSERDARGIRSQGLTKGAIPIPGRGFILLTGWQWLTLDGERSRQSWATKRLIRADRLACRLTIDIPEKETGSLYDQERLRTAVGGTDLLFDGWPGSENWLVFRGRIPKYWIRKDERWNRETERWEEQDGR